MNPTNELVVLHATRRAGPRDAPCGVVVGGDTLQSEAMQQWMLDNDAGIFGFDDKRRNETEIHLTKFTVERGVELAFTCVVHRAGVAYFCIHSTCFPDLNAILYRNTRGDIQGFIGVNGFSMHQYRQVKARCAHILRHMHTRGVFYGNTSPATIHLLIDKTGTVGPGLFRTDDVIIGDMRGIRSAQGDSRCDKCLLPMEYTYNNPYDHASDYFRHEDDAFLADVMEAVDADDMLATWGRCESLDADEVERARDWHHFGMAMVEILRLMLVERDNGPVMHEARTVWKACCLFPLFDVAPPQ